MSSLVRPSQSESGHIKGERHAACYDLSLRPSLGRWVQGMGSRRGRIGRRDLCLGLRRRNGRDGSERDRRPCGQTVHAEGDFVVPAVQRPKGGRVRGALALFDLSRADIGAHREVRRLHKSYEFRVSGYELRTGK